MFLHQNPLGPLWICMLGFGVFTYENFKYIFTCKQSKLVWEVHWCQLSLTFHGWKYWKFFQEVPKIWIWQLGYSLSKQISLYIRDSSEMRNSISCPVDIRIQWGLMGDYRFQVKSLMCCWTCISLLSHSLCLICPFNHKRARVLTTSMHASLSSSLMRFSRCMSV